MIIMPDLNAHSSEIDRAFPSINPGLEPFGSRILVQIRTPKSKTSGGILLTADAKDTELWNTQIAKVIWMGPLAFKNRTSMEPWVEGEWCSVGDFVRVPKYGGDRWIVDNPANKDEPAMFAMYDDLNLIGKVTIDPLAIKAFV